MALQQFRDVPRRSSATSFTSRVLSAAVLAVPLLSGTGIAHARTLVWTGQATSIIDPDGNNSNWGAGVGTTSGNVTNWRDVNGTTSSELPAGPGDTAIFGPDGTPGDNPFSRIDRTINNIVFDFGHTDEVAIVLQMQDPINSINRELILQSGTLTFNTLTGDRTVDDPHIAIIDGRVALQDNGTLKTGTWDIGEAGNLSITGFVRGQKLIKTGAGQLDLDTYSSFTNGIEVQHGGLTLGARSPGHHVIGGAGNLLESKAANLQLDLLIEPGPDRDDQSTYFVDGNGTMGIRVFYRPADLTPDVRYRVGHVTL